MRDRESPLLVMPLKIETEEEIEAWVVGLCEGVAKGWVAFWWVEAYLQIEMDAPFEMAARIAHEVWERVGRQRFCRGRTMGAKNKDHRPLSDVWMFGKQMPITDAEWKWMQIPRNRRSDKGRNRGGRSRKERAALYRAQARHAEGRATEKDKILMGFDMTEPTVSELLGLNVVPGEGAVQEPVEGGIAVGDEVHPGVFAFGDESLGGGKKKSSSKEKKPVDKGWQRVHAPFQVVRTLEDWNVENQCPVCRSGLNRPEDASRYCKSCGWVETVGKGD
jgi:hypothetical protein